MVYYKPPTGSNEKYKKVYDEGWLSILNSCMFISKERNPYKGTGQTQELYWYMIGQSDFYKEAKHERFK